MPNQNILSGMAFGAAALIATHANGQDAIPDISRYSKYFASYQLTLPTEVSEYQGPKRHRVKVKVTRGRPHYFHDNLPVEHRSITEAGETRRIDILTLPAVTDVTIGMHTGRFTTVEQPRVVRIDDNGTQSEAVVIWDGNKTHPFTYLIPPKNCYMDPIAIPGNSDDPREAVPYMAGPLHPTATYNYISVGMSCDKPSPE